MKKIYENVFNNYVGPNCISPININHVIVLFSISNFNIYKKSTLFNRLI